jgi:hypothetical protein
VEVVAVRVLVTLPRIAAVEADSGDTLKCWTDSSGVATGNFFRLERFDKCRQRISTSET